MEVAARGALAPLYTLSKNENLAQLRDKGWCIIPKALPKEKVDAYVKRVDDRLERDGFAARFGRPDGMTAGQLPQELFWSIDTKMYPLVDWAIDFRFDIREKFAEVAGVDPTTLASSFDGVMIKDGKYVGPNKKTITKEEAKQHLIPCKVDDKGLAKGPTHCDQSRYRRLACESHQIFCPLVVGDLSTIILVPKGNWTLQGIIDRLTERFPEAYVLQPVVTGKKRALTQTFGDKHPEGFDFDPAHRDYLISIDAVEMIKPVLNPGDMLIWSSAIPHCSGIIESGIKATARSPRLGIITAFTPKSMVSEKARTLRADVVGKGFATGQQILYPGKHGSSDFNYIWRNPPEKIPRAYKDHREWRISLRETPLWKDRETDTHEEKNMRARLRCLIGI
jgi:hypothetical protein